MQGFLDQLAILWENARLAPNGIDAEKLQNVMMLQVMIVAHFISSIATTVNVSFIVMLTTLLSSLMTS